MTIRLRRYRPDDLEATVAVWRASKRDAYPYVAVQQRYTLEEDRGHFRRVIAKECEVWLAEAEGRIVGLLALKADYVDQLFVAVDRQRQGVGTLLLRKAMQRSPAGLRLHTFQKNEPARAFYEKHRLCATSFGTSPPPEDEPDVEYHWRP